MKILIDESNKINLMQDIVTTKQVYELVDRAKNELTTHILRLESKFDLLEAGRVTKLETQMAELRVAFKPIKNVVFGLVGLILTAVTLSIVYLVIKR